MRLELLIVLIILVLVILGVLLKSRSKNEEHHQVSTSETLPAFMRHDHRNIVTATKVKENVQLPKSFDSRQQWPGLITPVLDQGACGSCWAFGTTEVLTDRVKIVTGSKQIAKDDYVSPFYLAACMKCPNQFNTICKNVCNGNYVDDVFNYLKSNGAYTVKDINLSNGDGTQYICFRKDRSTGPHLIKASSVFRVNPYGPNELTSETKLLNNTRTIMNEIVQNGPITATIRVYDPMSHSQRSQNFYLYTSGVYGANWQRDPRESDGYHLITVIGFGSELVNGVQTDYWIIRNSWGTGWGMGGYGKFAKGKNRAIIESDMWACSV